MSWYIAGALILIAGIYFYINWLLYLGIIMIATPIIILIVAFIIAIIGAMLS